MVSTITREGEAVMRATSYEEARGGQSTGKDVKDGLRDGNTEG